MLVWATLLADTTAVAGDKPRLLELHGTVRSTNGDVIKDPEPVVFLHGGTLPYNGHSRVGMDGSFRFRKLLPGSYVLIIAVPGEGEMRRTIDVTPTLADEKGRVRETFQFTAAVSLHESGLVHKSQLVVPKKAQEELQRSLGCLSRNDVERAKKHLNIALEVAPHFAEAWNQLGVIAYQTGQFEESERHFRRALQEDPSAYWALVNLGGALLSLNKDDEALEVNKKAVARSPGDVLAHSQLGKSYLRARDLEKAETHLRQAIALDPGHFSSPQLALADLYYLAGRYQDRIRELEEYLKYHPDGAPAPRVRELLEQARDGAKQ